MPTAPSSVTGDLRCTGAITAESGIYSGTAYVGTNDLLSTLVVPTSKQAHRHTYHYGQPSTVTSARESVCIMRAAGTVIALEACITQTAAVGAATFTVNLYKNGSSILTAAISLDSGDAVRALTAAAFSSTALVDGDVLEIVTVATAGGGTLPVGAAVHLTVDEDYAA